MKLKSLTFATALLATLSLAAPALADWHDHGGGEWHGDHDERHGDRDWHGHGYYDGDRDGRGYYGPAYGYYAPPGYYPPPPVYYAPPPPVYYYAPPVITFGINP